MSENKTNILDEEEVIRAAKEIGFKDAAFMNVADIVVVPEYRKYCEMNLCHCYNVNPDCPPKSGTVEEMTERVRKHSRMLVLQTEYDTDFMNDPAGAMEAKKSHNMMADKLVDMFWKDHKDEILRMSAGPWRHNSCVSAYCVDMQKMADVVGMTCWADDGRCRFFSQVLI